MANIWHDKRSTFVDENKLVAAKSQQAHPRALSVKKKQVFGELKNVIHNNQIGITPVKGGWMGKATLSSGGGAKSAVCEQQPKPLAIDPVELFDCFDFPKVCCTSACKKSDAQIWAEAECNQFDDIALLKAMKKIRGGNRFGAHDDDDDKMENKSGPGRARRYDVADDSDDEDLDAILKGTMKQYLFMEDTSKDNFTSCAPQMPKFEIFNDLPLLDVN